MHRIGIISDTHGLIRTEILETFQECDITLHAGNISRQSVLDDLKKHGSLYVIRSNADKEREKNLPGLMPELFGYVFYMVHNKRDQAIYICE